MLPDFDIKETGSSFSAHGLSMNWKVPEQADTVLLSAMTADFFQKASHRKYASLVPELVTLSCHLYVWFLIYIYNKQMTRWPYLEPKSSDLSVFIYLSSMGLQFPHIHSHEFMAKNLLALGSVVRSGRISKISAKSKVSVKRAARLFCEGV